MGSQDVADRSSSRFPFDEVYKDVGCSYHPACLTCPFSECRYDMPLQSVKRILKRERIQALLKQGHEIKEIAVIMGIGQRTAYRIMENGKV